MPEWTRSSKSHWIEAWELKQTFLVQQTTLHCRYRRRHQVVVVEAHQPPVGICVVIVVIRKRLTDFQSSDNRRRRFYIVSFVAASNVSNFCPFCRSCKRAPVVTCSNGNSYTNVFANIPQMPPPWVCIQRIQRIASSNFASSVRNVSFIIQHSCDMQCNWKSSRAFLTNFCRFVITCFREPIIKLAPPGANSTTFSLHQFVVFTSEFNGKVVLTEFRRAANAFSFVRLTVLQHVYLNSETHQRRSIYLQISEAIIRWII